MTVKRLFHLYFFIAIIWGGSSAFGQDLGSFKVSQLSDQQIIQIWQQFSSNGKSESDAIKELAKRGMKSSDVELFKRRLVMLQSSSKSKFNTQQIIKDTTDFMRDSSWVLEVPEIRKKTNRYGYDFFSNPFLSFEPNLRIATPKNYILGPDDELNITLTGLNETQINTKINADGNINIEYAGLVSINGLTMEEATERIKSKMSKAYPAISSGRTKLSITIDSYRTIGVTFIGEAERPGKYSVSSLSTLFNVLYLSGGPTENGTMRNIELIRNNKLHASFDLYEFLQKGKFSSDLRLEDQDVINFPVYQKRVQVDGQVKRPAVYELKENETLDKALEYAGGFNDSAYTDRLKVMQRNGKEKVLVDLEMQMFPNYLPNQADSIYAEKVEPLFENSLTLTGAIVRPGKYGFNESITLKKLLSKANGLREDAFMTRGYIKRVSTSKEREMISFDLSELQSKGMDLELKKGDSVHIPSNDELTPAQFVTIEGSVRNPGRYGFRKGMQLQDLILMAGGFELNAAYHRVELSRLQKNREDSMANQLVDVMKIEVDSTLKGSPAQMELAAQDYVFVPRLLNYRSLGEVKVRGEVLFPGNFALERRDETIGDVLERAGGLNKFGSIENVQVYRNGLRLGVDLVNRNSDSKQFLLLPGDSLFIPRNDPFVEVAGAVYNPQLLKYENSRFRYYVSAAGGIKQNASLTKAYIQYGNGINKRTGKFLFFRSYPTVKPGSKIIVPEIDRTARRLNAGEITAISGILTALVSLLAILKL